MTSLTFVRPAAQGPGTPGFQVASDPTIQPFLAPGVPAGISVALPIDFQVNGRPDLLVCHGTHPPLPRVKSPCRVLRPQSDGSVIDITRGLFGTGALPSMEAAKQILVGDFNGDGRPDMFIAASGYDGPPFGGETNVLLVSNPDGTYSDRSSTLPQAPDFTHSACVGDINGDGHLDIYVGNLGGSPVGPYFLMGRGDGTFTQKTTGLPPSMSAGLFNNENLPGGNFELFSASGLVDIDQDGYPDLVLGIAPNAYVDNIILFNDGTGDFTRRPRLVLPRGPLPGNNFAMLDIVSLDINRDGRPDFILLSSLGSPASGFGLQVLINRGDGTVADETAARLGSSASRTTGSYCGFLRFADFNLDGWEDLFCSNGPVDIAPRYWLNNGGGTWTPVAPGVLPPGTGFGVHAVDFEGDGRPDLVQMAHDQSGGVSYGSFLNRTLPVLPGAPSALSTSSSGSAVTVAWTAPTSGGAPGTYVIEAGSSIGLSNLANFSTGTVATSFLASGVPAGTYYVRVRAGNASGASAPSNESVLTVGSGGCAAPGAPLNLTTVSVSGGTVVVSWIAALGNPISYVVEAGSRSGAVDLANIDLGSPATSLTAVGVPPGTYYVRIRGRNACGLGSASNEVVITVGGGASPSL